MALNFILCYRLTKNQQKHKKCKSEIKVSKSLANPNTNPSQKQIQSKLKENKRNSKNQQEHTIIFDAPRMSVDFKTVEAPNSAKEFLDFMPTSGTLNFAVGESTKQISLTGTVSYTHLTLPTKRIV